MQSVSEVFDNDAGDLALRGGRWWITRETIGIDPIKNVVQVIVADGVSAVRIGGSPAQLRRLAQAIVAQIDGAVANTEV